MVRSAAKNHRFVGIVTEPTDYGRVLDEMQRKDSSIGEDLRRELACKAFALTARYDAAISRWMAEQEISDGKTCQAFPESFAVAGVKTLDLRYGENPHQRAAFYSDYPENGPVETGLAQLWGKEMSYNNYVDVAAAAELAWEFKEPFAAIIKHTNPCGAAIDAGGDILTAYKKALACDPVSAFGGIIAINHPMTAALAEALSDHFVEVLIAPEYDEDSLKILEKKKDLRVLKVPFVIPKRKELFDLKKVLGGILIQERDSHSLDLESFKTVTKRAPSKEEILAMKLGWKICKHIKSNAIVYASATQIVGVGAGQMSRVDSARFGIEKARLEIKGACMASDALIPFRDAVDVAAAAGVTAIVQTGGSLRDKEVIAAADEHDIAMVFTGYRHFYH